MPEPLTVYQLTLRIKESLETSFAGILVTGEISNFIDHTSGHIYFTLKDEKSQIKCTLWKWQRGILKFEPEDGMKVIIGGSVRVYEKGGQYQVNVSAIEPSGIGALQLCFEKLKEKLALEGLFDQAHKRPIPAFPERIGVVTSRTGAALHDIVTVLKRRMPSISIVLRPVKVQGDGAGEEIALAIREFNEYGNVDVLIVGRGGGSLEDLFAFNEEVVARAIYSSSIPIISAVGHEVDYTIADFTADLRAPTPSAAAEMAVPDRDGLILQVKAMSDSLASNLKGVLESAREKLRRLSQSTVFTRPHVMIESFVQNLDDRVRILDLEFNRVFEKTKSRLNNAAGKLEILNPLKTLVRGYSITRQNGTVLSDAGRIVPGSEVETILAKGRFYSKVERVRTLTPYPLSHLIIIFFEGRGGE